LVLPRLNSRALALHEAKLEPYLGYLHHIAWGLPSLILDFQDLYRYLVDDFVISYTGALKDRDFIFSLDDYSGRKCKRKFLNAVKRKEFLDAFDRGILTLRWTFPESEREEDRRLKL